MKTKPKTIPVSELKKELLKNKDFRLEYNSQVPEFQVACQIIEARIKKNMSQVELANKIHSGQAVISRLESLNSKPSLTLLTKIAKALDTKINLSIG
ncbi:helix-turn-helix transcriptional regulator [Candidatus Collierbacteria bacterium]|nr:helix-turn-helix transcriptional regulator [Candidatus Collierbacteria bacterium]